MNRKYVRGIFQCLTHILMFLFLVEWITPLYKLQYILDFPFILSFLLMNFLFIFVIKSRWVRWIGIVLTLLFLFLHIYYGVSISLKPSFEIMVNRIDHLTQNELKTLVSLPLMTIALFSLHSLMKSNKIILFVIATVSYLSILDSFFVFDGKWAVIRALTLGLIFISFESMKNSYDRLENMPKFPFQWLAVAISISLIIGFVGYISPKADAKWPEPTGLFENVKGKGIKLLGLDIKKTGYDEDDSILGGPLKIDDTVVMETTSTLPTYWKAEVKEVYTGKGWIDSKNYSIATLTESDGTNEYSYPWNPPLTYEGIEKKTINQSVSFPNERFTDLFFSGSWKKISKITPTPFYIKINYDTQEVITDPPLEGYSVESVVPIIDVNLLKKSKPKFSDGAYDINYINVELPSTTPKRVKELALNITVNYENEYDKVQAIQSYLKNNYKYDLNVPELEETQDFVDQFLFETKEGYCDYFSTSMVVLLRSVGIPSRWVKGFNTGEVKYSSEKQVYEGVVRNQNAHSWAEVYFEGVGWIPFDPTPGFTIPLEYKRDEVNSTPINSGTNGDNKKSEQKQLKEIDERVASGTNNRPLGLSIWNWIFILIGIMIAVVVYLLYRNRLRIQLWWVKKKVEKGLFINEFVIVVTNKMIGIMGKYKNKKNDSQTIREYLSENLKQTPIEEWEKASDLFDEARYSKSVIREEKRTDIWGLWRKILDNIRP